MARTKSAPSRRQLIKVSTRMFATRGFSRTTLRAIADAAGVNQGMIHYYWRTKIALYEEVYAKVFEDFRKMVEASFLGTGNLDLTIPTGFRKWTQLIVDETFRLLERQPFIATIIARHMMGEAPGTERLTEKYARPLFETAAQAFDDLAREGAIRHVNVRILIASYCFVIMGFRIGGDRYLFPGRDFIKNTEARGELAETLERLLRRTLQP